MLNFLLLIADLWILGALVILLHHYSPRIGFAPFLFVVGGLTVLLQSQLGILIEPVPGFAMFVSSNVLVPILLMAVLILYIANGAVPARLAIYSLIGVSLLALGVLLIYRLHLTLPGGSSLSNITLDDLVSLNPRTIIASLIAFSADMFVITVFYQGLKNTVPKLPEWATVGLALLSGLWTDAIIFRIFSDLGTRDFIQFLPGDLIGKTLSAIVLFPVLGVYMSRVAPRQPGYVGGENRPTFDVLFGSFEEVKLALVRTQEALRQSESERRQQQEYLEQITENVEEALWLSEPGALHAFYVNPAYASIWGISQEEILNNPSTFTQSLHPDDRDRVIAGIAGEIHGGYEVEYRIIRPDGVQRWVRDRAFPIRDETGRIYRIAGITEDITERKRMEQHMIDLGVEREKVKLLREFIGEASHDLKAPLTAINLKIYQLQRSHDEKRRAELVEELNELSKRMAHMIDDVLTLARLENLHEMTVMRVDLRRMMHEICQTAKPLADEKEVELVVEVPEELPAIEADEDDLARALTNLIDNAVHYTLRGGIVRVEVALNEREVQITVADTGIGIASEDQPQIFNRFFRAENARATDPGGTGLGLVIVKKVIEKHKGRVEVNSTIGVGTTFTVYLPLRGQRNPLNGVNAR